MSEPITNLSDAVAVLGALPMPVGPEPQAPMSLRAARVRLAQYGERTSTWSTATYNDGTEKALHEIALTLLAEVDRLEAERHVTNEALTDAAEALRANRDRIAELEALKPAAIQTCRVCGAGYSYGEPCSTCAFRARMAIETSRLALEDPHDSPLHRTWRTGRDMPETGGTR